MMNNSTIEALKAMRFSAMAAEFERQLGDPAAYCKLRSPTAAGAVASGHCAARRPGLK